MQLSITEDICSLTELQQDVNSILAYLHSSKRPVILTVNGRADAVLVDASEYEKTTSAFDLLKLLIPAEEDIPARRYTEATAFFKEFKRGKDI